MICHKTKYASAQFALEDIARIKKKSTRNRIPIRTYFCRCGSWHITSQMNLNELVHQVCILEETLAVICDQNRKNTEIAVQSDKRVIKLTEKVTNLQKLLAIVRNDKLNLINEILILKNKINENIINISHKAE